MSEVENFFDFNDTSDLSEETAKRLSGDPRAQTSENGKLWGQLVATAGRKVSMAEIRGAAERAFGSIPKADATVRAYLASAVEQGIIVKPTKASYAGAEVTVVEDNVDESEGQEPATEGNEADVEGLDEEHTDVEDSDEDDALAGL